MQIGRTFNILLQYKGCCTILISFQLRNGPDIHSPPLGPSGGNGRFCGIYTPSTLFTSDNEMFVQFISDNSNGGQGFKIRYEAKSLGKYFPWELYLIFSWDCLICWDGFYWKNAKFSEHKSCSINKNNRLWSTWDLEHAPYTKYSAWCLLKEVQCSHLYSTGE